MKSEEINWNGYTLKKEGEWWTVKCGKFKHLHNKSLLGLKREINRVDEYNHDAMLSYFSHGGASLNTIRSDTRED